MATKIGQSGLGGDPTAYCWWLHDRSRNPLRDTDGLADMAHGASGSRREAEQRAMSAVATQLGKKLGDTLDSLRVTMRGPRGRWIGRQLSDGTMLWERAVY